MKKNRDFMLVNISKDATDREKHLIGKKFRKEYQDYFIIVACNLESYGLTIKVTNL